MESAEIKKEEVRKIILHAGASSDLAIKLELVDTLQRIGVAYHYMNEIDELLSDVHDDARHEEAGCHELYITSLRFYLLRKHGYNVPSNVFVKFRDDQGHFTSNDDVNCLLMLYDAAHLRIRGEEKLGDAITFTKSRLESMMAKLEPEVAKEEGRESGSKALYLRVYEKKATRIDTILEFAKLGWWKNLEPWTYMRFARDRVVEMYFWMSGVAYEPQYSYSRIMLTKLLKIVSLMDDFCDNYTTTKKASYSLQLSKCWLDLSFFLNTSMLQINLTHNIY
ncbi:hypothetical protein EJB05_06629, partial [Eragrostis curvula]